MDDLFEKLHKATKDLSGKLENYIDVAPTVQEKLLYAEKKSSELDGLEYSDEKIEEIINIQMKNHPLTKELEKAMADFEEVFQ